MESTSILHRISLQLFSHQLKHLAALCYFPKSELSKYSKLSQMCRLDFEDPFLRRLLVERMRQTSKAISLFLEEVLAKK